VSDVSDYSAFLLPNPYRLIIDIHGRKSSPVNAASANVEGTNAAGGEAAKPLVGQAGSARPSGGGSVVPAVGVAPSTATNQVPVPSRSQSARRGTAPSSASDSAVNETNGGASRSGFAPSNSLQDVASLGNQPNRIKATRRPTTAPISASVAGATAAPQSDDAVAADSETAGTAATTYAHSSHRSRSQVPLEPAGIHEADPIAGGGRSLSRALGLKIGRIVVDAGHGGHDSGTLGPDGIEEKDVVLDVALRLGKMLRQRMGADVIFTRDDDTFIPLETRTAIANKAQADLFISVHANSSQDPDARGVETYYLSFTSSADALEVAARENAVSQQSIHELADLVKKIAMQDKIDESREFATDVERSLYTGLTTGQSQNAGLHDRGVKKAPFVVLIGANMPSILAEISFLTNPEDARQLRDPAYRQKIADSLYLGVARYVGGLSGVRLASNGRTR
jgi:N-acetylmuramoyl-L-alanine amidase